MGGKGQGGDVDPKAVAAAREKGLNVACGELGEQQYPDNSFQAIVMTHVIEHLPDPIEVLKECSRILAPGGKLVLITPNSEAWGHTLYRRNWRQLDPPRHLHIFSANTLQTITQRVGFKIHRTFTTVRNANGVFLASRLIHRTGRYSLDDIRFRRDKLWARGMQLAEWALIKFSPMAGEELVLLLEK